MPFVTDARIEALCARIRELCCQPLSAASEAELRELARELRVAIRQHVQMARSSLTTQQAAIGERDPE